MGTFRIDIEVEHPCGQGFRQRLRDVLVDTGAELSWFPADLLEPLGIEPVRLRRFRQVEGTIVERWVGVAIVHAAGTSTGDDVVFGEPGDLVILGARTLEGLNVIVDPVLKRLVDAGPLPAAAA